MNNPQEVKPKTKKVNLTSDPEYFKKYYNQNKEKYKTQNEIRKALCKHCDVCNTDIGVKSFSQHLRTTKHIRNTNQ